MRCNRSCRRLAEDVDSSAVDAGSRRRLFFFLSPRVVVVEGEEPAKSVPVEWGGEALFGRAVIPAYWHPSKEFARWLKRHVGRKPRGTSRRPMPTRYEFVDLSPLYQGAAGAIQEQSTCLTQRRTVPCHHSRHPCSGSKAPARAPTQLAFGSVVAVQPQKDHRCQPGTFAAT